jgi:hypothetical protein
LESEKSRGWTREKPYPRVGLYEAGLDFLMGLILNFRPTVLSFLFLFLDILNRLDDRLGTPNRD